MRALECEWMTGTALYQRVVLDKIAHARESVWIATANVKAMYVEREGRFAPVVELFSELARRGVELRVLHAELPSRPFREAFDRKRALVAGGLQLKVCPRVHFKAVLVDGAWLYLGSANLTGAGLGAKGDGRRNFEFGLGTEDFETIDQVVALFEAVWSGAECHSCDLHRECPDPIGEPPRAHKSRRKKGDDGIELGRSRRLRNRRR